LNRIIFLRDSGFNVSEIAAALKHWNDEFITKQLKSKRMEIESVIQSEQNKLLKIEMAEKDIRQGKIAIHYNVLIKSIPSYHVLSLRRIVSDYYAEGQLWKEMEAFAKKNNVAISSHTFTIYHNRDYREKDVDIEICTPVAGTGKNIDGFTYRDTAPVPTMASTLVHGKFENIKGAYFTLADWLQEHNLYKMTGQNRQIVHRGPWNEANPDNYLTEIQIPLKQNIIKASGKFPQNAFCHIDSHMVSWTTLGRRSK
jgi:effector-binding domain-containing protein